MEAEMHVPHDAASPEADSPDPVRGQLDPSSVSHPGTRAKKRRYDPSSLLVWGLFFGGALAIAGVVAFFVGSWRWGLALLLLGVASATGGLPLSELLDRLDKPEVQAGDEVASGVAWVRYEERRGQRFAGGAALVLWLGALAALVVGLLDSWAIAVVVVIVAAAICALLALTSAILRRIGRRRIRQRRQRLPEEQRRAETQLRTEQDARSRQAWEDRKVADEAAKVKAVETKAQAQEAAAWGHLGSKFDRYQMLDGPTRTSGEELVSAVADAIGRSGWGQIGNSPDLSVVEAAGRQMRESEVLLNVGIGETMGSKSQIVVVTAARFGVISKSGVTWHPLQDLVDAKTTAVTASGTLLEVNFAGNVRYRWWRFNPKGAAAAIVTTLRPSATKLSRLAPAPSDGIARAATKAQFLGGELEATLNQPMPAPGSKVEIQLMDTGTIRVIHHGQVVARFSANDPGITVDFEDRVKRSFRKGRLAATAAATMLIGPVGLLGLAVSTQKSVASMVLVIDTAGGYGLFALADSRVGLALKAATRGVEVEPEDDDTSAAPTLPDADALADARIERLERLSQLKRDGVISGEELEQLKKGILDSTD